MTTYTCPDGHASTTGDYCDVCGMPITPQSAGGAAGPGAGLLPAPGAAPAPVSPPAPAGGSSLDLDAPLPSGYGYGGPPTVPAPTDQTCPNCGASNLPDALYCEDCGYDFTTGQLPRPLDPPMPAAVTPVPGPGNPPAPDTGAVVFTGSANLAPAPGTAAADQDVDADVVEPAAEAGSGATSGPVTAPPVTPTSAPGHVEWVAEVWVDPDWYASQDVSDPCPSAGMPWVIPVLERTVLIGRVSASRNIHPQIDISTDSGVSRRHAQLSSDGQRWWVEDLQSANGTYVGAAGAPLPATPIVPGQRVELAEDDRVYLGAWSRVVVRRATPEESTLGS